MMRSALDRLNNGDLSAILQGNSGSNNNSNGGSSNLANFLLGARGGQGQQNAGNSLASLTANLGSSQNSVTPPTTTSIPQSSAPPSQTTQLLSALLQQQQREDEKRAALLNQLGALSGSAPPPNNDIGALLQAKQMALPGSGGLGSIFGASISGVSAGQNIYGGPTQGGNIDAAAIAKLLQSQQAPSVPSNPAAASAMAAHLGGASATTAILDSATAMSVSSDRKRKGRTGAFPQKLHQMLTDLERQEGGTDIASFLPHGRAFSIHKPRDFVKHIMPKYFRMSRFSSFQRQLNLYDFQRITEGPDKGAYYHELFVQGRPILSTMMKRNKIKGVKSLKQQEEDAKREQTLEDAPPEDIPQDEGEPNADEEDE